MRALTSISLLSFRHFGIRVFSILHHLRINTAAIMNTEDSGFTLLYGKNLCEDIREEELSSGKGKDSLLLVKVPKLEKAYSGSWAEKNERFLIVSSHKRGW